MRLEADGVSANANHTHAIASGVSSVLRSAF
jgi:hypothetical protein